jgi:hypothetical protein
MTLGSAGLAARATIVRVHRLKPVPPSWQGMALPHIDRPWFIATKPALVRLNEIG